MSGLRSVIQTIMATGNVLMRNTCTPWHHFVEAESEGGQDIP